MMRKIAFMLMAISLMAVTASGEILVNGDFEADAGSIVGDVAPTNWDWELPTYSGDPGDPYVANETIDVSAIGGGGGGSVGIQLGNWDDQEAWGDGLQTYFSDVDAGNYLVSITYSVTAPNIDNWMRVALYDIIDNSDPATVWDGGNFTLVSDSPWDDVATTTDTWHVMDLVVTTTAASNTLFINSRGYAPGNIVIGGVSMESLDTLGPIDPYYDERNVFIEKILSWTAPDDPGITSVEGYTIYIDPNQPDVVDGITVDYYDATIPGTQTTYDPSPDLDYGTEYFWKVVASVKGGGSPRDIESAVWKFTTIADITAGDSILITTDLAAIPFNLGGFVGSATTIGWEAFDVAFGGGLTTKVTFTNVADPDTTVTISESGTYILTLTADGASDSKEIVVIDENACDGAKATGEWTANYYDRDDDCDVDIVDFSLFALEFLDSTELDENYLYAGEIPDGSEEALLAEYWTDLVGNSVETMLNDSDYPANPDGAYLVSGELRGAYGDGDDGNDDYGQRIRGYIVAPTTDSYTFYIASDDSSRLILSTDTTAVAGVQIAEVVGSVNVDTWTTEVGQTSLSIGLTAGNYYYIEVLHKEGGGFDHVSVGWSTGGAITVIPGSALRYALP